MEIEIRAARADDRGRIAELIHSSGPDVYDFLYRDRALAFLRYEFASGRGFAGYPHLTVAVLDGEVVGTGSFYDCAAFDTLQRDSAKNFVSFFGLAGCAGVFWRARRMSSIVRRPKPGELYLANFAVSDRLRSRGVGSRLIQHKLSEARQAGYQIFGLDVSTANPRGQALYQRLGLVVTKEKVFSDPSARVNAARKMERAL